MTIHAIRYPHLSPGLGLPNFRKSVFSASTRLTVRGLLKQRTSDLSFSPLGPSSIDLLSPDPVSLAPFSKRVFTAFEQPADVGSDLWVVKTTSDIPDLR